MTSRIFNNKKLILHISNTDLSSDSRIIKEINSLKKINNVNIYGIGLSAENKFSITKTKSYTQILIKLDSKNICFLRKSINLIELFLKIIFYSFRLKPQIIHCHDAYTLIPCFFISHLRKIKIIYDAHELESDKNGQNIFFKIITIFFEKIMWKRIDLLISVSGSIINWYLNKYGDKNSLILYNKPLISEKYKYSKKIDLKKKFNISPNDLLFIYVGDFCHGRGIELILEVFIKYRKNSNVVFLGDGVLKDLIYKNSIRYKNIFFHGKVSHDVVVGLTSSCDVGLCFIRDVSKSDRLSLPNKLFEYASSGINVIASDLPEIATFVRSYNLGIVSKYDLSSLNKSIQFFERNNLFNIDVNTDLFFWQSQEKEFLDKYKEFLL